VLARWLWSADQRSQSSLYKSRAIRMPAELSPVGIRVTSPLAVRSSVKSIQPKQISSSTVGRFASQIRVPILATAHPSFQDQLTEGSECKCCHPNKR
jgi:hypothetical protein